MEEHHKNYLDLYQVQIFYFTNWTLALIILHKYSHQYFNLLFMSFFVLVAATYIFYYKPGCLPYSYDNEVVAFIGTKRDVIHFFWHVVPFLFILVKYGIFYARKEDDRTLIPTIILIFVYGLFVNFPDLYMIDWKDVSIISFIFMALYALMYKVLKNLKV